ncbi:MAG: DNA primase [Nitrospirae bacterium]|nr:DNA primase [Nitrospirota bacterium]
MSPYDSTLEDIKNRLDIVEIISEYVHLKKAGQNWKGLCPFHAEKTPSFMVSPSKQIYHCFGCGSGGDIFTFLVRHESISFSEAAALLSKRAGVTLKKFQKDTVKTGEKETLLNLHKDTVVFYQNSLLKNAEAMGYLKKRGVSSEAQRLFFIGYAPYRGDALYLYLKNKGYKAELLKKAGLVNFGTKGCYDTFRQRIIFPIFDLKGDVIAFGGRTMSHQPQNEPKYLNSPETPIFNKGKILYGLNLAKEFIKKSGYVIFAEGYLDVITLHMYGFFNAVAPLGTALSVEHGKLIKRFTEDAILVFDGDEAGIRAAKNAIGILLESGLNVKALLLPEGEDPDSFLRKNGKEAFGTQLVNAMSLVDFFMRQKGNKHSIAHEVLETICRAPDSVLQGHYIKLLSEGLKINELFIREELKKVKKTYKLRGTYTQRQRSAELAVKSRPQHEVYMLQLFLNFPEKAEVFLDLIPAEDLIDPVIKSIFKKMKEGVMDYNVLISECGEEEKNFLTENFFKKIDFDDPEKAMEDCLKRFKKEKQHRLLDEIQDKIKEAELKKDSTLLKTLQLEQQELLGLKRN